MVGCKRFIFLLLILAAPFYTISQVISVRGLADTVGFAHTSQQMDELMLRLGPVFDDKGIRNCRLVISPHDDYSYAGELYTKTLSRIKRSGTVLIFAVAHKAKSYGLEDKIIFDSFSHWKGPYKEIRVSPVREEIMALLPHDLYIVHDSIQSAEHSAEALIPFLQYFNRDVEIVTVLVPAMSYERMEQIAGPLAEAIGMVLKKRGWKWGKELSIAISNDAVHYGDEGWNGRNFAFFGTDSAGYKKALAHERKIMNETLLREVSSSRIKSFTEYTVKKEDHREYRWTWCGRYSVPFGMLASYRLQKLLNGPTLKGRLIGYSTSVDRKPLNLKDIGLDVTAPANLRHWVGYAGIAYE